MGGEEAAEEPEEEAAEEKEEMEAGTAGLPVLVVLSCLLDEVVGSEFNENSFVMYFSVFWVMKRPSHLSPEPYEPRPSK